MHLLDYRLNIVPINVFIDPQYPVEKAIITHAHADHAKPGHKKGYGHKDRCIIPRKLPLSSI